MLSVNRTAAKFTRFVRSKRAGLSAVALVALIVIAGSIGGGLYLVSMSTNSNHANSQAPSSTNQTMPTSANTTIILSSSNSTKAAITSNSISSNNSTTSLFSRGRTQTVFGRVINSSTIPTAVFPKDTMVWTNYVLLKPTYIDGIVIVITTTPSSPHSRVIIAAYINSSLVEQEETTVGPPVPPMSDPNYTLPSDFTSANEVTVTLGSTVPAGAVISVAIWSNTSSTLYLDNNDPIAHGTVQYPLPASTTSLPQILPSSTQSLSDSPDFWANNEGQ
jgi:hypothetical protein